MKIFSFLVIGFAALALALFSLTIKIKPGETGVVNAEWTSGFVEHDFGPGYHWDIGPFHTWTVFDTTVQTLNLNRDTEHAAHGEVEGPLIVKSGDGATVTTDVTIKYQIAKDCVWKIFKQFGAGERFKLTVKNEASQIMRVALGSLRTEDFYDPIVRERVAHEMEGQLRKQLELINVKLVGILIRDLSFDAEFERRIKDKVLAQQDVELNIALTRAADYRGRTKKIEADTEAKVQIITQERDKTIVEMRAKTAKEVEITRAQYLRDVAQIKSDADLYVAQKEAEATRLLKEAEAEGQKLRREALVGASGDLMVALEMARNVNFGTMVVSTQQIDPLDLQALLRRFGVSLK